MGLLVRRNPVSSRMGAPEEHVNCLEYGREKIASSRIHPAQLCSPDTSCPGAFGIADGSVGGGFGSVNGVQKENPADRNPRRGLFTETLNLYGADTQHSHPVLSPIRIDRNPRAIQEVLEVPFRHLLPYASILKRIDAAGF